MGLLAAAQPEKVITTMPEALVNTLLGMGTVFVILILISFVIYLLKFIPELLNRSEKKSAAEQPAAAVPKATPTVPRVQPTAVESKTEDTQLVAVITAAVAAAMEQEGTPVPAEGLVIRSIKKRY
ncbi:MAG: OadG family protein [Roseburia sp.]|nr:OadG family protein [Roseburia sp.]